MGWCPARHGGTLSSLVGLGNIYGWWLGGTPSWRNGNLHIRPLGSTADYRWIHLDPLAFGDFPWTNLEGPGMSPVLDEVLKTPWWYIPSFVSQLLSMFHGSGGDQLFQGWSQQQTILLGCHRNTHDRLWMFIILYFCTCGEPFYYIYIYTYIYIHIYIYIYIYIHILYSCRVRDCTCTCAVLIICRLVRGTQWSFTPAQAHAKYSMRHMFPVCMAGLDLTSEPGSWWSNPKSIEATLCSAKY